jgi:hypothetical protein
VFQNQTSTNSAPRRFLRAKSRAFGVSWLSERQTATNRRIRGHFIFKQAQIRRLEAILKQNGRKFAG